MLDLVPLVQDNVRGMILLYTLGKRDEGEVYRGFEGGKEYKLAQKLHIDLVQ